jgi:sodium-type flagellar protein MotY
MCSRPAPWPLISLFCGLSFVASSSQAETYGTGVAKARWSFESASSSCTLTQVIPGFGKAVVRQSKVKPPVIVITLDEKKTFPLGAATVSTMPPVWRNDLHPNEIAQIKIAAGRQPISVESAKTIELISQLKNGVDLMIVSQPSTAVLSDKLLPLDAGVVRLVLDARGFSSAYKKHQKCVGEVDSDDENSISYLERKSSTFAKSLALSNHSSVGRRTFAAEKIHATWKVTSNPFVCSLSHEIPDFGRAVFINKARASAQFYLELQEKIVFPKGAANLDTFPPPWDRDSKVISVAKAVAIEGKQPIILDSAHVKLIEKYLSNGVSLVFTSAPTKQSVDDNSVLSQEGILRVVVEAKNFLAAQKNYEQCVDNLIPFTLAQISRLVFHYSEKSDELADSTKTELAKVVRYMKADSSVLGVLIDAHSDNVRTKEESEALTKKQAEWMSTFLREKGIAADKIKVRWHGDKFPIANNGSADGQIKNRRVTLRLETGSTRTNLEKRVAEKKVEDQKKALEVAAEAEKKEGLKKLAEEAKINGSAKKDAKDALKAARVKTGNKKVTPDDIHNLVEGLDLVEKQK